MAYSSTIDVVQGDRLPELEVTLKDSNKAAAGLSLDEEDSDTFAPIDITGHTVRLRVRKVGSSTVLSSITGTITGASTGKVTFIFDTDTFDTPGVLEGEVELSDTNSPARTQTVVDLIKFKVRSQFG